MTSQIRSHIDFIVILTVVFIFFCISIVVSLFYRYVLCLCHPYTGEINIFIEYLIHTYYILLLILYSKLIKILALMAVLIRFNDDT